MILETFTNSDAGLTAFVSEHNSGGFGVSLRDDEAGEFVGIVRIFPTIETATAYAKTL